MDDAERLAGKTIAEAIYADNMGSICLELTFTDGSWCSISPWGDYDCGEIIVSWERDK